MKLYPKQLNSVAELKKERRKLLQLRNETQKDGLNPLDGLFGGAKGGGKRSKKGKSDTAGETSEQPFNLLSLAGSFLNSGDMLQLAIDFGLPLLGKGVRKIKINFLEKAAKEFFGGYIRWKALSLGFKIAGNMLRNHKKARN
ncbi:hypothetical protein ACTHGU_11160 [Chitinophagaceae bacterium MMS25-I14]